MEATTRAVKVDALNPWSIVETRYAFTARTAAADGSDPVSIHR